MEKKKSKRKVKERPVSPEKSKPAVHDTASEEQKPFDFGGLPNRDLKKNLGCG